MNNLVNFPTENYENTGEGGLAVFFIIRESIQNSRQVCLTGGTAYWGVQDVVISPIAYSRLNDELSKANNGNGVETCDLIMLVASTKNALWNENFGYFAAEERHLTEKGKQLFDMLTEIYEQKPDIVTLLDT